MGNKHAHEGHDAAGPEQKPHGKRPGAEGGGVDVIGSRVALTSILSAARARGYEVPAREDLDDMTDEELWREAAARVGDFSRVQEMLRELPERREGEALRQADIEPSFVERFFKPRGSGGGRRLSPVSVGRKERSSPTSGPADVAPPRDPAAPDRPTQRSNARRLERVGYRDREPRPTRKGARILGRGNATTKDKHTGADGRYTRERMEVHDAILMSLFEGKTPQDRPKAIFKAGGPGSGKTSADAAIPAEMRADIVAAVQVDPDDIKARLDEYRRMLKVGDPYAAAAVHAESSDIAARAIAIAQEHGYSFVADGTGNAAPGKFEARLEAAAERGYEVSVIMVDIPTEVAVDRAITRAFGDTDTPGPTTKEVGSGRMVPPPLIRDKHASAVANVAQWAKNPAVDRYLIYSNDVPKGSPPLLIAEGSGDAGIDVWQPELWDYLARKGQFSPDAIPPVDSPEARRVQMRRQLGQLFTPPDKVKVKDSPRRADTDTDAEQTEGSDVPEAATTPAQQEATTWREGDVEAYHRGLKRIDEEFPGFVTVYDEDHYRGDNVRVFTSPDGQTGYNLTDHGDGRIEVAGVFNWSDRKGAGTEGLKQAVRDGANYLEAYDGFLPFNYARAVGAVPSDRWPWDDQYRHPRWQEDKYGLPGVMTMDIPTPEENTAMSDDERKRKFEEAYTRVGGGEGVPEDLLEAAKRRLRKQQYAGFETRQEYIDYMWENADEITPDVFK